MSEIEIEKGVPMPNPEEGWAKYPWHKMEVGDSFLFPEGTHGNKAHVNAAKAGQRYGKKFNARKENGTYRCWRTA